MEPLLKQISDILKKKELHALIGEKVIPTKNKINGEVIHYLPALWIPEIKVPIEITTDKKRDEDYMSLGMLPMVIVPKNFREGITVEKYIDNFLDFHEKWRKQKI